MHMTDAELIVLGLVAEEDSYGYQIEAKIKERNIRNWADIGFSSIYYVLSKLEKQGFVASIHERSAKGPSRRVFSITNMGRHILSEQVLVRLEQQLPLPSAFYVGLSLVKHVDSRVASNALVKHDKAVHERLKRLEQDSQAGQQIPTEAKAMFELGRRLGEAEKSWLEEFTSQLRNLSREA